MNRETFAIGMFEYAGIAALIVVVIFAGAFDFARSRFACARRRPPAIPTRAPRASGEPPRSSGFSE